MSLTVPVSTASLNPSSATMQQFLKTRQTDLRQLGKDLGTGDLSGAEAEYQDIVNLGKSGPLPNGESFLNSRREQDFSDIGQALQSGNLAGAQQAFGALKSTFENTFHGPVLTGPVSTDNPVERAPGTFSETTASPILSTAPLGTNPTAILSTAPAEPTATAILSAAASTFASSVSASAAYESLSINV